MKKVIVILLVVLLSGCAGAYRQATYTTRQAYVGMHISQFESITGNMAKLEAMEAGYTIYKMVDYDAWTGAILDVKFFYFDSSGKLYKIDGGQFRQSRYQIEIVD